VTAPPHRRGPAPRPATSFKYHLRSSVRPYWCVSPTRDNLVSAVLGYSTMPLAAGLGSGKETAASLSDLAVRLDRLEEIMRALTAKVGDVDQQQQAFSIALVRLEQGRNAPAPTTRHPRQWRPPTAMLQGVRRATIVRSRHHLVWNLGRHHLLTVAISLRRTIRTMATSDQLTTKNRCSFSPRIRTLNFVQKTNRFSQKTGGDRFSTPYR
jgi:hypothetical protein